MQRTQVLLDPTEHRRARKRAAELGISLAEYIRRLVRDDLSGPIRPGDVSAILDLGDSGGSDIASDKDRSIGEALAVRSESSGRRSTRHRA